MVSASSSIRPHFVVQRLLRPHGKHAFLASLADGATLIDVGCGNRSPLIAKRSNPSLRYVGIDIGHYNQIPEALAASDDFVVVSSDRFADAIWRRRGSADAVLSSHNLEHCDAPDDVLAAMCDALKPGGRLYLAFPSEASLRFPSRRGTLNYLDDPTHKAMLDFNAICRQIEGHGLDIQFRSPRYRPAILYLIGALLEPLGAITRRNMPLASSWAFHGFEAIIWATRKA